MESALDRFAQFFIKPLMKKDAITREREAVESGTCHQYDLNVIIIMCASLSF